MSSLIIRKHSAKVWEHIPSDQPTPFYLSKFYVSLDDNKIRIVEQGESKRNAYSVFNITIEVVGGGTFTGFTSASALLEKLEELGYPAFYKDGELVFTPENVANKATNLTSPNNTTYPTTQAVVNGLDGRLPNAEANYTNATLPFGATDKAIVFQSGVPKLVNVSELGGGGGSEYFYVSFNGYIQFVQAPTSWFGRSLGPQNVGWYTTNVNLHTQNIGTNPLIIDFRSGAISFPFNCILEDVEVVLQRATVNRSVRVNFNVYTLSGGLAVNTRNVLQITTDSTQKKLTNSDYTIPNITINKGERITSVVNQITDDTGVATNWDFVLKFKKV